MKDDPRIEKIKSHFDHIDRRNLTDLELTIWEIATGENALYSDRVAARANTKRLQEAPDEQ